MNTAFGAFNLAVAIRGMRPDSNNNHPGKASRPEERTLAQVDYSLLISRSICAGYVFERSASVTRNGAAQTWATLANRVLVKISRWGVFAALKSASTPAIVVLKD
jgi:hypothetical protein